MKLSESIERFSSLRRRIRLIALLDAAEVAGLVPLRILWLHAFAYLSNVLAPVWDMPTLDGKILKRRGGPFYPTLQRDLDRLVGLGLVMITDVGHVKDDNGQWRLEGSYQLNRKLAGDALALLRTFEEDNRLIAFVHELAYALSALSDQEFDAAVTEDATYSNPLVSVGNVVDFDEWRRANYSANAAKYFDKLIPSGARATPGEKIHLYVRHLHWRMHASE